MANKGDLAPHSSISGQVMGTDSDVSCVCVCVCRERWMMVI